MPHLNTAKAFILRKRLIKGGKRLRNFFEMVILQQQKAHFIEVSLFNYSFIRLIYSIVIL